MKVLVEGCWAASLMYVSEAENLDTSQDSGVPYPHPQRLAQALAVQTLGTLLPLSWVTLAHLPPSLSEPALLA